MSNNLMYPPEKPCGCGDSKPERNYRWVVEYKTLRGYVHKIQFQTYAEFKKRVCWVHRQAENMEWAQFEDRENNVKLSILECWEAISKWATK